MRLHQVGVLALGVCSAGCVAVKVPPPPPPQTVLVRVTGDPGEPLVDVDVKTAGGLSAKTNALGVAKLALPGHEGAAYDLSVACPKGHAPPSKPPRVVLRRSTRTPEFDVACKRLEHNVVVAVKTTRAAGIPIVYFGKELARTNADGYAVVEFEPRLGDTLTLTLDTSDPKFRYLRPQSPELSLAPATDDVFAVEQRFVEEIPKPPRPKMRPKPTINRLTRE